MKKINIVRKNNDFNRIIDLKNSYSNRFFMINIEKNEDNIPKFGIAISKKLGKANVRNKNKRQIKNIIDLNKNIYQNNLNYIIIVKKEAINSSYKEKEEKLIEVFNAIVKEKK